MSEQFAEKFIKALNKLEAIGDVETIASLFSDDAQINNVVTVENSQQLNAREFWTKYRATFGEVNSVFRNKIEMENSLALEWTTTGTSADGSEIHYDGVSILETDGTRITRFFAYFDPNNLGRQMNEETARGNAA